MDLMLLNPYFQGTTKRIGAPLWGGRGLPYNPVAKMARSFIASSRRNPSTYGQVYQELFCPGICFESFNVSKRTNLALAVGSTIFRRAHNGNPIQGMTIDHPSTHRSR